jgi:hypothetical protein
MACNNQQIHSIALIKIMLSLLTKPLMIPVMTHQTMVMAMAMAMAPRM